MFEVSKSVSDIQIYFKQLRLAETAEGLPELIRLAEQSSWTYLELLEQLTTYEIQKREIKSIEKRMKWAQFPYQKHFRNFK